MINYLDREEQLREQESFAWSLLVAMRKLSDEWTQKQRLYRIKEKEEVVERYAQQALAEIIEERIHEMPNLQNSSFSHYIPLALSSTIFALAQESSKLGENLEDIRGYFEQMSATFSTQEKEKEHA
ncbi:MAG: hypothetical protein LBM95_08560 [Lactobacillales bacterium]|nr:hypothetical protein [Lactobacillales bacterium]